MTAEAIEDQEQPEVSAPKRRRRRSGEVALAREKIARRRFQTRMTFEAICRLKEHALYFDRDPGEVLEVLILTYLRRFSIHDLGEDKASLDWSKLEGLRKVSA